MAPTWMKLLKGQGLEPETSIYKYFKGKKDLHFFLINEKVEEITRLVRAELGKDLIPIDKIELIVHLQFP